MLNHDSVVRRIIIKKNKQTLTPFVSCSRLRHSTRLLFESALFLVGPASAGFLRNSSLHHPQSPVQRKALNPLWKSWDCIPERQRISASSTLQVFITWANIIGLGRFLPYKLRLAENAWFVDHCRCFAEPTTQTTAPGLFGIWLENQRCVFKWAVHAWQPSSLTELERFCRRQWSRIPLRKIRSLIRDFWSVQFSGSQLLESQD